MGCIMLSQFKITLPFLDSALACGIAMQNGHLRRTSSMDRHQGHAAWDMQRGHV
jgi:hypothetical protein